MQNEFDQPLAFGRTAEIHAWQEGRVLKLFFPFMSADAIDHEAHAAQLVSDLGLPAPRFYGRLQVNGREGMILDRLEGYSMLKHFLKSPFAMQSLIPHFAAVQAQFHARPGQGLPPMHPRLRRRIENAPGLPDHLRDWALRRLAELPQGDRVCHGDYHPDNVLVTEQGFMVIDWMDASCGNPLADAARTLLTFQTRAPYSFGLLDYAMTFLGWLGGRLYLSAYLKNAQGNRAENRRQLLAWFPVIAAARLDDNIPGEQEQMVGIVQRAYEQEER